MRDDGSETILLDLFRTNQVRERLIATAMDGLELPPEDYPFYVLVGAEGPWTPTGLARRLEMPLSTMLFRLGRLERRGHAERAGAPDVVVVDPPRAGLSGKALRRLARLEAPRIVYVSCNPTTLAANVKELAREWGYRLERVRPVDMFPHTPHVESVALLTKP